MPQSSSGQLAVVDADHWKLLDLDPANAGFNQAPLGVLPSQIVTSDDGCRLLTANHGSCDLSLVDPAALLAPTMARDYPGVPASTDNAVTTAVVPKVKGVPLRVLPGEVAFVPQPTAGMTGGAMLCQKDWSWRALVTFPSCDLVALVDLPSGEIIDGAYVRETTAGFTLEPLKGAAPVCAAPDCTTGLDAGVPDASEASAGEGGAEAGVADAGADAGADDAGPPPTMVVPSKVPPRPGPIAIVPETGRAYVGLGNGDAILTLDVTKDHITTGNTIRLADRPLGTSRLRLSIDPYLDTAVDQFMIPGRFIGDKQDRRYLYAVARDGSVRIVQVSRPMARECEANIDPLNLPPGVTLQDACIPVDPMHRRPTALGPGVRLPSPAVDVAVADIRPAPVDQSETTVEGAHAWALTASGAIYLINIDPVRRLTSYVLDQDANAVLECKTPSPDMCQPEPEPQPNVPRNQNVASYSLTLDPTAGPARVDNNPSATVVGPHIEPVWTRGTALNATALTGLYQQTPVFFPDPLAVRPQTWSVTWEGALVATPRLSGHVLGLSGSAGLKDIQLYDPGSDFCRQGVQAGDLVTLSGCTNDTQCGLGKVCAHGNEGTQGAGGLPIGGLCLNKGARPEVPDGSTDDPGKCEALLGTVRRYEVEKARQNILVLKGPHKDELVKPGLRPCVGNAASAGDGGAADGGDGGDTDGGVTDGGAADASEGGASDARDAGADGAEAGNDNGCGDPTDPSTSSFKCEDGRCLLRCDEPNKASGCRAGRICVQFDTPRKNAKPKDPLNPTVCEQFDCFCADGPDLTLPSVNAVACIGELLGYQVNVGRGFLVSGGVSGIPVTETPITDPDDMSQSLCVPIKNGDPRNAMRISMDAPRCNGNLDNTLDSRCNPDVPGSCPLPPEEAQKLPPVGDPGYPAKWREVVSKLARDLVNIDRSTPGPNACLFEGGPNASDPSGLTPPPRHVHALFRNQEIQFMMTNLEQAPTGPYQIRFDVHGGFKPQPVIIPPSVEVTMPARLVLGPVDSLVQSPASYPGEVPYLFVVDQRRLGRTQGGGPTRGQLLRINPLGYQVLVPQKGMQPWYEDFAHSGNTFPIQ
jgi:hypothetical protein